MNKEAPSSASGRDNNPALPRQLVDRSCDRDHGYLQPSADSRENCSRSTPERRGRILVLSAQVMIEEPSRRILLEQTPTAFAAI
jgi:hypothetical protein